MTCELASLWYRFPSLLSPTSSAAFSHSLFFRGVSLFTRRILVAQDEFGGYLLSIDRFWQHAKSFWPSLRGLTFPFIYPSFSLSVSLTFFFRFSHLFHTVLISSILNYPAITSLPRIFSSFIVLMRSLCRHALYLTDAFLFFFLLFLFLFRLYILFAFVILSWKSFVHLTFIPKMSPSWVFLGEGLDFQTQIFVEEISWNQLESSLN